VKILWLKTELLHPVDKGGKIRTFEMLKSLRRDHEITYLTLADPAQPGENFQQADEYCHRLITVPWRAAPKFSGQFYGELLCNLASPLPYALQKYRSAAMRRAIDRELNEANPDVLVCDFLTPSVNLGFDHPCPKVLFQHNVESLIWRRHYETTRHPLRKLFFYQQWRRMQRYESVMCRRFDAVVAVARSDREMMRREFGASVVFDVPTGVDTNYFQPLDCRPDPLQLVFTGSMDWMPNEDAIVWFAEKILPFITRVLPGVSLVVVGRNPSPRLIELSKRFLPVFVTGGVDDVRPYLDRAAAFIVPMRQGGGTRLKIYEAMAMGKPVITTSIGAEGLPLCDGRDVLIADEAEAFAHAVIRLLTEPTLARRLGQQARALVCEFFGWDRAAESFAQICARVARNQAIAPSESELAIPPSGGRHQLTKPAA
jgi:sugar transferase (PEP-CTERM/EpsH1 system associated)